MKILPFLFLVQATSIYTGCSDLKQCFGLPEGCVSTKDCKMITSLKLENGKVDVELVNNEMKQANYLAMAFSGDEKMGDDLVFVCSPTWIEDPRVKVFWNSNAYHSDKLNGNEDVPKNQSIQEKDSRLTCMFSLEKQVTIKTDNENKEYNFEEGYHILLASGPVKGGTGIEKHTEGKMAFSDKFGKQGKNTLIG